jgi:uncharacterized phage-associated protein
MINSNQNKLTSQKKLAELIKACIKYGADKDGKITKTKLAKLVYLSDFAFYYKNLVPITGVTYKKLDNGPVSLAYFDELLGLVGTHKINLQKKGNVELLSLADITTDVFLEKKELELTENVCKKWKNKKTDEIVKFTHEQLPWKISFENDVVPYSLIIQQDEAKLY